MNYGMIRFVLSWILRLEGLLMFLPCVIALVCREEEGWVYLILAGIAVAAGVLLSKRPKNMEIYQKEGFVSVGLSWILLSCYGAVPFVITKEIPHFLDALFEIVSGFTTTGASILTDVEALSRTSLFWRSFSHWIGGMGVLVFILMLLPTGSGGSHMNLMRAESPGPEVTKFVPRVRATARLLYKIYLGMTIIELVLLLITRMNWFDALCITFGTAGTGGFGVLNSSCGAYTPVQQWIITIFMLAFGVNFGFYYLLITRKAAEAFKMEEVRTYLLIVLAAVALISWNVYSSYDGIRHTVRDAAFQVASIITTTGYSTTDFDLWPTFSRTILLTLMMIGACAGSTGGGIKVSRVLIMVKEIKEEMRSLLHPRSIRKMRIDGHTVQEKTMRSVMAFLVAYFVLFWVSFMIISIDGFSVETNFSAVAATLNNIGPGLDAVGPTQNYFAYSILSKAVLIFDMLAGRLELLPIFVLLYPGTWKRH